MATQSRTSYSRIARNRARLGLQGEADAIIPRYTPGDYAKVTVDRMACIITMEQAASLLQMNEEMEGNTELVRKAHSLLCEALAAVE